MSIIKRRQLIFTPQQGEECALLKFICTDLQRHGLDGDADKLRNLSFSMDEQENVISAKSPRDPSLYDYHIK